MKEPIVDLRDLRRPRPGETALAALRYLSREIERSVERVRARCEEIRRRRQTQR